MCSTTLSLVLKPGLDVVYRRRSDRCEEAGEDGGDELAEETIPKVAIVDDLVFYDIIGTKFCEVENDRTLETSVKTFPESKYS